MNEVQPPPEPVRVMEIEGGYRFVEYQVCGKQLFHVQVQMGHDKWRVVKMIPRDLATAFSTFILIGVTSGS